MLSKKSRTQQMGSLQSRSEVYKVPPSTDYAPLEELCPFCKGVLPPLTPVIKILMNPVSQTQTSTAQQQPAPNTFRCGKCQTTFRL